MKGKGTVFIEHIKRHLKDMHIEGEVHCKICHMTVEEIYEEYKKHYSVSECRSVSVSE